MIKYSISVAAVLVGTCVATYAAIAPESTYEPKPRTKSVFHNHEAWPVLVPIPVLRPIIVETCAFEECSATRQS